MPSCPSPWEGTGPSVRPRLCQGATPAPVTLFSMLSMIKELVFEGVMQIAGGEKVTRGAPTRRLPCLQDPHPFWTLLSTGAALPAGVPSSPRLQEPAHTGRG